MDDRSKTEESVALSLGNDAGITEMERHRDQDGNNELT